MSRNHATYAFILALAGELLVQYLIPGASLWETLLSVIVALVIFAISVRKQPAADMLSAIHAEYAR